MKKLIVMFTILGSLMLGGCGAIDTGNSGVKSSLTNIVDLNELSDGFYTAVFSSVEEHVGKEIRIDLDDMTPKAGDNLRMQELDVEVYYTADKAYHADLKVKYANSVVEQDGYFFPAYLMVKGVARSAVYAAVGDMDSLTIHRNRDVLRDNIKERFQLELDAKDDGVFKVSRVVIKKADTDATLEKSIQKAVEKDKELEAKKKDYEIKLAEAKANDALTASLTPNIMRLKELDAMVDSCTAKGSTCILDFTGGKTAVMPLLNVQ